MQNLRNANILVTGGAGFIGSSLCEYFVKNGNKVICLDNLSTGLKKNLEDIAGDSSFTFVEGDIRDFTLCSKVTKNIDIVFHQAALGSVPRSVKDPLLTNEVNVGGFLNILTASRDARVKRFIYAASSSIYGDAVELPKIEPNIGKPLSPYAVTKFVNELYADVFSRTYGMDCIGLRYFNVFGRRQTPEGAYAAVIPLWIKKLIKKESPVINGDGTNSRDFTYIDNVIHANESAAVVSLDELKKRISIYNGIPKMADSISEVFNVACGDNTSLKRLFDILKTELSKYDSQIAGIEPIYGNGRMGDIPHSLASIEKIKNILDYKPLVGVRQGLEKICEWYWNNQRWYWD